MRKSLLKIMLLFTIGTTSFQYLLSVRQGTKELNTTKTDLGNAIKIKCAKMKQGFHKIKYKTLLKLKSKNCQFIKSKKCCHNLNKVFYDLSLLEYTSWEDASDFEEDNREHNKSEKSSTTEDECDFFSLGYEFGKAEDEEIESPYELFEILLSRKNIG